MSFKSKNFTLYLIVILVASCVLLTVEPCVAPEPTKPDKPTFTIEVSDDDIYLNITNEPFTPYTDNGSEINLYYEAYIKRQGAVDSFWTTTNLPPFHYVMQTDSQYTKLYVGTQFNQNLDVKVRAVVGTIIHLPYDPDSPFSARYEFKGVEGKWSNTQTITINRSTSSPTSSLPSNTSPDSTNPLMPSPLEPDFDDKAVWSIAGVMLLAVVVLVVGVVLVIIAVVLLLRRGPKV